MIFCIDRQPVRQLLRLQHLWSWLALVLVLTALLTPSAVLADAPGTRGEEDQPQGSTASSESTSSARPASSYATADWQSVQLLPPLSTAPPMHAEARRSTLAAVDGENSAVLPWLSRELNPGNWILDAGMGIFTAITATFGEMLQQSVMRMLGTETQKSIAVMGAAGPKATGQWSVIPSSCGDGSLQNFVFCTPASLTYEHPGVRNVWGVLRAVASGLVTILFIVRLGRMMSDGPRALAMEGKPLILTFVFVMLFVQGTPFVCGWLITFFNAISESILANASFTFPAVSDTPFELGARIMGAFFWLLMLMLTLKSFFRVIAIAVLVGVAPLAGAMLMDRATAGRFRSWIEKLIELLLEQIALIIVLTVATAMLAPIGGAGGGDQFVSFLLGSIGLLSALFGPSAMIGIASGVGGGYLQSMLQMRMIGGAQRAATAGAGHAGRAGVRAARAAGNALQARGGDPVFSAAAQRMAEAALSRRTSGAARQGASVPFRMPDVPAASGDRVNPTIQRYARAASLGSGAGRKQQAAIRAQAMMAMADGLDRSGQGAEANRMRGRAGLQRAFAAGDDISRTPRWGTGRRDASGRMVVSARGLERRAVFAQALSETQAQHGYERDRLTRALTADRAVLAEQPTPANDRSRRDAHERLVRNQARLTLLNQGTEPRARGGNIAPVTRQEAAALARERWAEHEGARRPRPALPRSQRPAASAHASIHAPRRVEPSGTVLRHQARRAALTPLRTASSQLSGASSDPLRHSTAPQPARSAGASVAHVQRRAGSAAVYHQQQASQAFDRVRELQDSARSLAGTDPARAATLQQHADRARREGQRHIKLHGRTNAISRDMSWQRPVSRYSDEERARRRQVYQTVRAEVLRDAARDDLLPLSAPDHDEYLRRARRMQQAVQHLARERLQDLAAPSKRSTS
jgi:hypothetical protein